MLASGCVYNLNAPLPPVVRDLTITGSNDTIRRNSGNYTIFRVFSANLTLNRLNVTNGNGVGTARARWSTRAA